MKTKTTAIVDIRLFTADDHDIWLPLWRGYQEFYKVELSAQVTRTTWNRFLDRSEPMFGALALVDGRAVGMVHWILHRSCWTVGNYCYLQDLYVATDRRGCGIGRKLIEHVYTAAREAGAARVYWLTHETNTDAMQLYDRIADRSGFLQYRKIL
ncbi:MAG: GNAT family N-acetyltransferase [Gammaproteobacteria bacterium]|nr:GNAT family N-acetyltransferase [Gammaproteobacteria bacterium]